MRWSWMTSFFALCLCLYVVHADAEAYHAPAGCDAWRNRMPRQPVVDSFEEGLPFDLEKLAELGQRLCVDRSFSRAARTAVQRRWAR